MPSHSIADWSSFFSTAAEAAATLAGLVIVTVSVNIRQILNYDHLPSRAAAAVGTLILILVSGIAALIPQPVHTFAIEILVMGAVAWLLQVHSTRKGTVARLKLQRPTRESVLEIVSGQLQTLPFIVGGISLLSGRGGGLYWIAGGIIAIFIFSTLNTWVLLVEILR